MDTGLKYCPKCDKKVETVWKFNRERCTECNEGLDENPIKVSTYVALGNQEISRRSVETMLKSGDLTLEDLK